MHRIKGEIADEEKKLGNCTRNINSKSAKNVLVWCSSFPQAQVKTALEVSCVYGCVNCLHD